MKKTVKIKNENNEVISTEHFENLSDAEAWAGQYLNYEITNYAPTQPEINKEAREYLSSTDWHIVKHVETGYQVPEPILNERIAARLRIIEE